MVYKNIIKEKVSKTGKGEYELFIDDTHREHKISENAAFKMMQKESMNKRMPLIEVAGAIILVSEMNKK